MNGNTWVTTSRLYGFKGLSNMTKMMAKVTTVKVLDGYRLRLRFQDSAVRVVDLTSMLWGPMFAPMRKLSAFRKVRVNPEFGCIEWPNGADLCPDDLRHWRPSGRKPVNRSGSRFSKRVTKMNKADKIIAKELKCSRLYKLKVKSKKTGKWEFRLFGCSRKGLESTVMFYKEKFGKEAKVVKA